MVTEVVEGQRDGAGGPEVREPRGKGHNQAKTGGGEGSQLYEAWTRVFHASPHTTRTSVELGCTHVFSSCTSPSHCNARTTGK